MLQPEIRPLSLPFDRMELERAVKGAPGLSQEVADLTNWSAGVGAVLFAAFFAIKLFA